MVQSELLIKDFLSPFEMSLNKAQKKQVQILEAVIENFASTGIDKTTYESIAASSRVSRALVHHYYPDWDELVITSLKYIRSRFQEMAANAIQREASPKGQLKAYIASTFLWLKNHPLHVKAWLLFYYYCGISKAYRDLNTELVNTGQHRIQNLLIAGKARQQFKFKNVVTLSKMIQNTLTGTLLTVCTENIDSKKAQAQVEGFIMSLVLGKISC